MSNAATGSDVFLSYSRADAAAVQAVRARLSEAGVDSFLDRTRLPAGQPWLPFLEQELGRCGAVAIFLGQRMGSWQRREVQVALGRQDREQGFPVIPILLPGLDDEPTGFLALQTWIDLREGADDPSQLQNLLAAIHREAPEGAAAIKAAVCPYRGLLPFREEDAAFFFGRDGWIADLTAKARAHPLVAVVGRSGSGKSSLVYAGLLPALRKSPGGRTWDMLALRPGHEPLNSLAAALSPPPEGATAAERIERINADADRLRRGTVRLDQLVRHHLDQQPGTDRLLLYVDQWEELYTLAVRGAGDSKAAADDRAGDARESAHEKHADVTRFIDLLLAATAERNSPLTVVLTVRADFYDHLLRHATLPAAIQGQQVNLGPMTRAQLQQCIERPASAVGLHFEGNLVENILDEVGEDEGKLPLLEYALRETWKASRKTWQNSGTQGLLTFAAYNAIGRVGGAIGTRAQQIYERLDETRQQAARRLFVSLVTPGEGQEDTRARATVPDEPAMAEVVREFSDPAARLLVTGWDHSRGEPLAEVSHEALIHNWGTLRTWIAANREILRTRERIRGQMKHWEDEQKDPEYLLPTGRPLEEGRDLRHKHGDVIIDDDIRDYVALSSRRDKELKAEEQRRRDEERERQVLAAHAIASANKRTAQRTAVGLVVALAFAALAGWQWYEATNQQKIAERSATEAEEARDEATAQRTIAEQRAKEAEAAKIIATARAAEAEAARIEADKQQEAALRQESRALAALARSETQSGDAVNGMLLALRGMPIPAAEKSRPLVNETREALVDATLANRELRVLRGHEGGAVSAAEFSPDGARIVSGSSDTAVRIWDAQSGAELMALSGHERSVRAAGFSPGGARIVSGSDDKTVRVWDADSGAELLVLRGHEGIVWAVGFSPDETRIVSTSADTSVRVWDAHSGTGLLVLRGHEDFVGTAEFSPDGTRIVTGSLDGTVRVWDAASGAELLVLRGHRGPVFTAAFSPDGRRIVSGSGPPFGEERGDTTMRVWDADSGDELVLRGHKGAIRTAGFSPDGARIVSGSDDKTVRVWDADSGAELLILRGHEDWVRAAGFSTDGARIVSGSWDGTVRIWDVKEGQLQGLLFGDDDAALVASACEKLPRDLSKAAIARFNLVADAPWPCAERAQTLWPHPVAAAIFPAAGPEEGRAVPAPR